MVVLQANVDDHADQVRDLFWAYLQWANSRTDDEYSVKFDIQAKLEDDMKHMDKFLPPQGRLLMAKADNGFVGLACLRKLTDEVCEVKRMYVKPAYRGKGIGKKLFEELIQEARGIGYRTVRLDSARFMQAAQSLYRSEGFSEVDPYPESEIPAEFHAHWIFMEKHL